jgi:transporter family protein
VWNKRGETHCPKKEKSRAYFPFFLRFGGHDLLGGAPLFGKAAMLRIDPWTGLAMRSFVISLIMLIWVIVTGHFRHLVQTEYSSWGLIFAEGI